MICCKCGKPIERSYGRVTDLGNYCYQCAMQNEIEAKKAIANIEGQTRKETAKEIIEEIKSLLYPEEGGLLAWLVAIADKYGVEVQE